jgi:hypothetical protein
MHPIVFVMATVMVIGLPVLMALVARHVAGHSRD